MAVVGAHFVLSKAVPQMAGVAMMVLALWGAYGFRRATGDPQLALLLSAVYVFIVGGSGLLLFLRSYRLLAKLWISVFAIVMLATLLRLPKMLGVNPGSFDGDSPWPHFFAVAGFLAALWAAQRFVIVADQYVDNRVPKLKQGEPGNAADSR